ncbi:hypothetical protein BJY01DRAFT_82840 [Aspergillus pseudoustus]|uniref:Uncharacterized protein n=1 Tax=Aspergillus pseudoustus TaxID=1810923 RepID=A0ABR4KKW8_9EURO
MKIPHGAASCSVLSGFPFFFPSICPLSAITRLSHGVFQPPFSVQYGVHQMMCCPPDVVTSPSVTEQIIISYQMGVCNALTRLLFRCRPGIQVHASFPPSSSTRQVRLMQSTGPCN